MAGNRKTAPQAPAKSDILDAVVMLAREKDIAEDLIISAIEEACKAAYRKSIKKGSAPANLAVSLTRQKGVQVFARKLVCEEVEDETNQISLEEARKIAPNCQADDIVEIDVTPSDFGRVAAMAAKQVIMQRLREAEHGRIYDEMSDKENEILTGIVLKADARSVLLELGRTQGVMEARLKQWRNRTVSDGYEPGSTFKTITLASALEEGAVSLDDTWFCGGEAKIERRDQILHCWYAQGHGAQTTAQALQNSCNIAFANIGIALGGEKLYEYVKAFGLLEKTGIDLPGEGTGYFFTHDAIANPETYASLTSAAFGQTFKVTPIQLVRAISAVVNGGYVLEPFVVSEVLDDNGSSPRAPPAMRRWWAMPAAARPAPRKKSTNSMKTGGLWTTRSSPLWASPPSTIRSISYSWPWIRPRPKRATISPAASWLRLWCATYSPTSSRIWA